MPARSARDALTYETLRTLAGIDPAIAEVIGFTRYRIQGNPEGAATISIADRGGVSLGVASRVDTDPVLRGTKHRVATDRRVLVTRGRRDQRLIAFVPEVKDKQTVGITLLYLRLVDQLEIERLKAVLKAYRGRYDELHDAVLETEPTFDESLLATIPLDQLLVLPAGELADRWRD